jgi:hypothetical protein
MTYIFIPYIDLKRTISSFKKTIENSIWYLSAVGQGFSVRVRKLCLRDEQVEYILLSLPYAVNFKFYCITFLPARWNKDMMKNYIVYLHFSSSIFYLIKMHEIIFGRGSTVLPEILIRKRDHSTRKYERGGVRSKGKIERGRGPRYYERCKTLL